MNPMSAWAIALGISLGLGLWSIAATLPRLSGPSLADRVAPYIVDVSEHARVHTDRRRSDPLPILGAMFAPLAARLVAGLSVFAGGNAGVQRRIDQARLDLTVAQFRYEQLLVVLVAGGIGAAVSAAALANATLPAAVALLLPLLFGISGAIARDVLLQRRARARASRITEELPTVLEFLSLTLSAGEGILDSLKRVARVGTGELSAEFRRVVDDVATGVPLATALSGCSRRVDVPALGRAIEQLSVALERGAPLADVLRAQAQDARSESKRMLLESAGRKEVAMLVPLVFFILPLSVAFAIYPGVFVLQAGF
ncbi:type II secretion system F family protein [Okibacterium endophyticum]